MSRRTDELAARIRARRPHVRAAVAGLVSADELARRVRRHPGRWIAVGLFGGALAGRFFGRPLVRAGGRQVASAAAGRLQHWGIGLLTTLLANMRNRASEPAKEPEAPQPAPGVAAGSTLR